MHRVMEQFSAELVVVALFVVVGLVLGGFGVACQRADRMADLPAIIAESAR